MPLSRMRTAEGVLEIIKADDPGTEVTLHYIRRLIHSGKVSVTPVGRKKLVDADTIIGFIAAGESTPETNFASTGQIRRVAIR